MVRGLENQRVVVTAGAAARGVSGQAMTVDGHSESLSG